MSLKIEITCPRVRDQLRQGKMLTKAVDCIHNDLHNRRRSVNCRSTADKTKRRRRRKEEIKE